MASLALHTTAFEQLAAVRTQQIAAHENISRATSRSALQQQSSCTYMCSAKNWACIQHTQRYPHLQEPMWMVGASHLHSAL